MDIMDNMNLNGMEQNDTLSHTGNMNMEQNSSLMRYLEQAAIQPPQTEKSGIEEIAATQQMQDMTSPSVVHSPVRNSILQQMPNIQGTVVPLEKQESLHLKKRLHFPKIKRKEPAKEKTKKKENLLDVRKLTQKVNNKEIDVLEWITMYFIASIPVVNIIVLSMWALGKTNRMEKVNWAKANLITTIGMYLFIGISVYVTLWDIIKVYLPF